jgi:hypothetical protein
LFWIARSSRAGCTAYTAIPIAISGSGSIGWGRAQRPGLQPAERVATFAWNHHRHLELYLAVPMFARCYTP